jgi:hypothetical protein
VTYCDLPDGAAQSLDEIRHRWNELDARWQDYLDRLKNANLEDAVFQGEFAFRQTLGNITL